MFVGGGCVYLFACLLLKIVLHVMCVNVGSWLMFFVVVLFFACLWMPAVSEEASRGHRIPWN